MNVTHIEADKICIFFHKGVGKKENGECRLSDNVENNDLGFNSCSFNFTYTNASLYQYEKIDKEICPENAEANLLDDCIQYFVVIY